VELKASKRRKQGERLLSNSHDCESYLCVVGRQTKGIAPRAQRVSTLLGERVENPQKTRLSETRALVPDYVSHHVTEH
jgi:hypothetical protein